jgi:hypothetical protein
MRATLKVLIALLLIIGPACGDDDDPDAAATATTASSDTTTTTAPADITTTTAPEMLGDEPPLLDDAASGSGCTPRDSADLPDGWWYGTIAGPPSATVDFDLACYYVGAAAEQTAASRGDEVNNDYYVVNDNPALRTINVETDAAASCVDLTDQLAIVDCEPSDVDGEWAVWLRMQGGSVDRIVEQYAP